MDLSSGSLTATLVNELHPEAKFVLTIANYGGIARLHVTEKDTEKQLQRFSVPEVLSAGLNERQAPWQRTRQSPTSISVGSGEYDITLAYKPFTISVTRGSSHVLVFNAQSMFEFEHLRTKQVLPLLTRSSVSSACEPSCCLCDTGTRREFAGSPPGHWRLAWRGQDKRGGGSVTV